MPPADFNGLLLRFLKPAGLLMLKKQPHIKPFIERQVERPPYFEMKQIQRKPERTLA